MVNIEWILSLGVVLLRLVVILVLTIGAIIISRLILKRLLWPKIKKTKTTADDRIFRLLESSCCFSSFCGVLQALVRLFGEVYRSLCRISDDLFFLLYWSIGVYITIRLISIVSNWYLSRIPLRDREAIDQRVVRSIQYIFLTSFRFSSHNYISETFRDHRNCTYRSHLLLSASVE